MAPQTAHWAVLLARTLAIAAIGGVAFDLAAVPAAYLSGAILAVAGAALFGVAVQVPRRLRDINFLLLGIIIGTTVDAETLRLLPQWPVSLAGLVIALAVLLVALPRYFQAVHGLDKPTARLAAIPGAMSQVVAMSEDLAVDGRKVVILHTLRLAILMILIPAAFGLWLPVEGRAVSLKPVLGAGDLALLIAMAVAGYFLVRALRFPSPAFTGALMSSAVLAGSGTVVGQVHWAVVYGAFVVMGATIGMHFSGLSRAYLISCLGIGLGGIALAILITGLMAWPVAELLGLPFLQIWLAYAPGGFDSMAALALSLGVDPAFVAGHQFARLLCLFAVIPFLFRGVAKHH